MIAQPQVSCRYTAEKYLAVHALTIMGVPHVLGQSPLTLGSHIARKLDHPNLPTMTFDHLSFGTHDIAATRAFYGELN
jgi:hypothetical protein